MNKAVNLIDKRTMYIDSYGAIELISKYFKGGDLYDSN